VSRFYLIGGTKKYSSDSNPVNLKVNFAIVLEHDHVKRFESDFMRPNIFCRLVYELSYFDQKNFGPFLTQGGILTIKKVKKKYFVKI